MKVDMSIHKNGNFYNYITRSPVTYLMVIRNSLEVLFFMSLLEVLVIHNSP